MLQTTGVALALCGGGEMKANLDGDPEYFQALEALASVFGVALVPCDMERSAASTLPNGRTVIFVSRKISPEEAGAVLGQALLELQVKAVA